MIIKTKYNLRDTVFVMSGNNIVKTEIKRIEVAIEIDNPTKVVYQLKHRELGIIGSYHIMKTDKYLYDTKEDLINSLNSHAK